MPRRAVPGLALALSPANVKDPGGEMSADYDYQFDVGINAPEPVPPPATYPAPQPTGISSDGVPQESGSVPPGYDPAAETWPQPGGDEQQ
jgi:hypothetical protein